jgi:hypothetical protein
MRTVTPFAVIAVPSRTRVRYGDRRRWYRSPVQCSALRRPVTDGGLGSLGGWTTLGAVLAVLVLVNKSLNDAVHIARAVNDLPRLQDRAEEAAPRVSAVARLRSLARFVPFHRVFHSVELTLVAFAAGVVDAATGDGLDATRVLVAVLVPVAVVTVLGHLAAVLTSSRLR